MSSLHPGVTFYEEDRGQGPFTIRIGGTSEFVSWIGQSRVNIVEGWNNPKALQFSTMEEALRAADQVWDIEGYHTSIEVAN